MSFSMCFYSRRVRLKLDTTHVREHRIADVDRSALDYRRPQTSLVDQSGENLITSDRGKVRARLTQSNAFESDRANRESPSDEIVQPDPARDEIASQVLRLQVGAELRIEVFDLLYFQERHLV